MGTVISLKSAVKVTDTIVENERCCFELDADASNTMNVIDGTDKQDTNNYPRCYSVTRRSWKKAWAALQEQFTSDTTMHGAISILWANGIKMHSYCGMD